MIIRHNVIFDEKNFDLILLNSSIGSSYSDPFWHYWRYWIDCSSHNHYDQFVNLRSRVN